MKIAQLMENMIAYSQGNLHDIDHFVRVWNYAKTIAELEEIDADTRFILEAAAITHDIACPLCREKYGNTNGKRKEIGSRRFLPVNRRFPPGDRTPGRFPGTMKQQSINVRRTP